VLKRGRDERCQTKDRFHVILKDRIDVFIGTVMKLPSGVWMWWFDGDYLPLNRIIWPRLWTETRKEAIDQLVRGYRLALDQY
jgi:hypothetical protein